MAGAEEAFVGAPGDASALITGGTGGHGVGPAIGGFGPGSNNRFRGRLGKPAAVMTNEVPQGPVNGGGSGSAAMV